MKKIISIIFFAIAGVNFIFAQTLPLDQAPANTGSNMTVFFTPEQLLNLELSSEENNYLVAVSGGIVVGHQNLTGLNQAALAVWGDDAQTDIQDGAGTGAPVEFFLVKNDSFLFSIPIESTNTNGMPTPGTVLYATNNMLVITAIGTPVNLTEAGVDDYLSYSTSYGCTDSSACNYDDTANANDDSCEFAPADLTVTEILPELI